MSKKVIVEGKELIVPDDATPDEIDALSRGGAAPPPTPESKPGFMDPRLPVPAFLRAAAETVVPEVVRHPGMLADIPGAISDLSEGLPTGLGAANVLGRTAAQMGTDIHDASSAASEDQFSKGNFAGGVIGAIPMIGPGAVQAGEEIGRGEVAKGLGHGAGMIGSVLAPGAVAKVAGKVMGAMEGAEAASGMSGLGKLPTNAERINANMGLKPKHYKGGYQPAEGVLRQGIDDVGTTPEVAGRVEGRMTELAGKKGELLKTDRVAGSARNVREAADMLKPLIEDAKMVGDKALVKRLMTTRKSIRDLVTPDVSSTGAVKRAASFGEELSPADLDMVVKRIDSMIEASTGSAGRKVRTELYKIRKTLSEQLTEGDPNLRATNQDIRDLIPAKQALKEKMLAEEASTGPRAEPLSKNGDPMGALELLSMAPGKAGMIARLIRRATK